MLILIENLLPTEIKKNISQEAEHMTVDFSPIVFVDDYIPKQAPSNKALDFIDVSALSVCANE